MDKKCVLDNKKDENRAFGRLIRYILMVCKKNPIKNYIPSGKIKQ